MENRRKKASLQKALAEQIQAKKERQAYEIALRYY